jgi:O-antigen biosynthesis protein
VTPGVSVVICAHDQRRWESLVGAVASVEAQSEKPSEIIVAIDHNEPLLEQVRALLPRVTAIPNDLARGLGGARNSGVHAASGSVVAFLDDDAVADPEWLARLGAASCRCGRGYARVGSRTSSTGSSVVPTEASRQAGPPFET